MGEEVALRATICCVLRSGGDFRPEHVQWLARQVPGIVCLSDVPVPGVPTRPLKTDWPTWWAKLEAFGPSIQGDMLLMDLDTVVLRMPGLPTETTVLSDFNRPEFMGSGFMYVTAADRARVWKAFTADPQCHIARNTRWPDAWGDQGFLMPLIGSSKRWGQNVRSYKIHCRNSLPDGTDVCCFHGEPRPWNVPRGPSTDWIPAMAAHKDFRDLILKHKGARICVMGGAPSLTSDLSKIEADIFISTNGHGVHLRDPGYLFAMDDTNTQKSNVEMGGYLRGLSSAPIIAPRGFADYHLGQWPQQPRWVLSGMTATWAAFVMGASVVILAGFDAYGGAPGYIDEGRKMARDVKCPVRVASGPLTAVWPQYDPDERFGQYVPHSAIDGWLGKDGRITIKARKQCMVGNLTLNPGEILATYRQNVWRLLKHRMVEEVMPEPEPVVHEAVQQPMHDGGVIPAPAEAPVIGEQAEHPAPLNRAGRRRARRESQQARH